MRGSRLAGGRAGRLALLVTLPLLLALAVVVPRGGATGVPVVVTSTGGAVSRDGVTLTFADGAVTEPTTVDVADTSGLPAYNGRAPLRSFTIEATTVETGGAVGAFAAPVQVELPLSGIGSTAQSGVRLAELTADGAWRLLGAGPSGGTLSAPIATPGTFGVVADLPAEPVGLAFDHSSSAPDRGLHRVDPGSELRLDIGFTPAGAISGAQLVEAIPTGWAVVDAGGGAWQEPLGLVMWDVGSVPAGTTVSRSFVVRAPRVSPVTAAPAFSATFPAHVTYAGGSGAADDVAVLVAPAVIVAHTVLATVDGTSFEAGYLPPDEGARGVQPFDVLRVRFQLRNADTVPVTITPQLEVGLAAAHGSVPVPEAADGRAAFRLYREWTRPPELHGLSRQGPATADIPVGGLRIRDTDSPDQRPVTGIHSMAANPVAAVTLEPLTYTEVEFTVEATQRAKASAAYLFRLTDAGVALPGTAAATVQIGSTPHLRLSPGQRRGRPVDETKPAVMAQQYPLVVAMRGQGGGTLSTVVTGAHGPYSATADQCALCHVGHTAKNKNLLVKAAPQSEVCLTCHDGSGASTDVAADYTDPAVPANRPARREYYRHDALTPSEHTNAQLDEFGGVLNRHSECGDCHNAHKANGGTDSTPSPSGWSASSRLANISSVSVVNHGAGTSPTYTFNDGSSTPAFEYELCFKCHSGATILPSNEGFAPSRYELDKGVEFNPANPSYHPVEAPGTNTTQKMQDSLDGTSPYKLWRFTTASTIRCTSCHASASRLGQGPAPAAGSSLPPHTSQYRGILLQNYRDRVLKSADEPYSAADFALCFLCHGEAPFAPGGGTQQTNFSLHRLHVGGLAGFGSGGTSIDTPGDGQGNALCAECHFRIHSTTYKAGSQTITGTRLVNFAPNVLPLTVDGVPTLSWTSTGIGSGTCTLLCHGKPHVGESY